MSESMVTIPLKEYEKYRGAYIAIHDTDYVFIDCVNVSVYTRNAIFSIKQKELTEKLQSEVRSANAERERVISDLELRKIELDVLKDRLRLFELQPYKKWYQFWK